MLNARGRDLVDEAELGGVAVPGLQVDHVDLVHRDEPFLRALLGSGAGPAMNTICVPLTEITCWPTRTSAFEVICTAAGSSKPCPVMIAAEAAGSGVGPLSCWCRSRPVISTSVPYLNCWRGPWRSRS